MTIEELLPVIFNTTPYFLIKLFAVILLLLHLTFSVVLIRQTKLMVGVLEAKISPTIYAISIVHFLVSLFTLVWTAIFF